MEEEKELDLILQNLSRDHSVSEEEMLKTLGVFLPQFAFLPLPATPHLNTVTPAVLKVSD